MHKNQIKRGMIVVVKEGIAYGNPPGTITKILGRPGEVVDEYFITTGKRSYKEAPYQKQLVVCENIEWQSGTSHLHFRNKPARYEFVNDLRPATTEEKEYYQKLKRSWKNQK